MSCFRNYKRRSKLLYQKQHERRAAEKKLFQEINNHYFFLASQIDPEWDRPFFEDDFQRAAIEVKAYYDIQRRIWEWESQREESPDFRLSDSALTLYIILGLREDAERALDAYLSRAAGQTGSPFSRPALFALSFLDRNSDLPKMKQIVKENVAFNLGRLELDQKHTDALTSVLIFESHLICPAYANRSSDKINAEVLFGLPRPCFNEEGWFGYAHYSKKFYLHLIEMHEALLARDQASTQEKMYCLMLDNLISEFASSKKLLFKLYDILGRIRANNLPPSFEKAFPHLRIWLQDVSAQLGD